MSSATQPVKTRVQPPPKATGGAKRVTPPPPSAGATDADHDEQTRMTAQRAAHPTTRRPGILTYAAPHGSRPPVAIVADKRWRKEEQTVTVKHARTGKAQRFDIYSAWILIGSGQLVAEGVKVWEMLLSMAEQMHPTEIRFGHVLDGVVHPWDQFARGKHTLIYLTTLNGRILYYDSEIDGIREATHREFLDTIVWGAVAKAGKSAEGMLPLYNALVFFALRLVPGGTVMENAVRAFSLLVFWQKHEERIRACIEMLDSILRALRVVYRHAPKLGTAMLRLALGQAALRIQDEVQKEGLVMAVAANLDGKKFTRYVAEFFAVLLKLSLSRFSKSGLTAKVLDHYGLKTLAKIASVLNKWRSFTGAAGNVASGGGLKDPQNLATAFLKMVGEAGVKLTPGESEDIVKEAGYRHADVVDAVNALDRDCKTLEVELKRLADDAEKVLF